VWRRAIELAERYGTNRYLRAARAQGLGWAYLDGQWDDALKSADELIAAIDAGDRHFTDPGVLSLSGWIHLARGETTAADRDTARAAELAGPSDVQAHSQAYCTRAATALALGRRDEADQLASELAAMGPPLLGGLCVPFPNAADVAWVFRDLGREREFSSKVLDPDPIKGPWHEASRAIVDGNLVRAADVIESIGHTASAAYARLRAAQTLAAAGRESEAATQRAQAESFYREVGAIHFLRDRIPAGDGDTHP
jgi:tetratricopeptide (TPR) repeat protein